MNKVDLHLHTSLSDGLMNPEDVVLLAKQNECKVIAITDHELLSNFEQLEKKYDINIMKYLYHIFYLNSSKNVRQNSTFIYPNS